MSHRQIAIGHLIAAHSALSNAGCSEDFVDLCDTVRLAGLPRSIVSFDGELKMVMQVCASNAGVLDIKFHCDYSQGRWYKRLWRSISHFCAVLWYGQITYQLILNSDDFSRFKDMFLCDQLN